MSRRKLTDEERIAAVQDVLNGMLKSEMYYLRRFTSKEELISAIVEYIDYYNTMENPRNCGEFHVRNLLY